MVCNICIVRMITFLEDDPLSRQRIQPYNKLIKQQLRTNSFKLLDNKNVIKLKKKQQFGYGEEVPSSPEEGSVCSTKRWEQHRQGHQNSSPSQNTVSPRLQTDIHSILTRKWKVMYNILNCHRLTDELLFTCLLTCEFYYDPNPINQKQGFRYQKRRFYFAMPKKTPTYCRKVSVAYILTDQ